MKEKSIDMENVKILLGNVMRELDRTMTDDMAAAMNSEMIKNVLLETLDIKINSLNPGEETELMNLIEAVMKDHLG